MPDGLLSRAPLALLSLAGLLAAAALVMIGLAPAPTGGSSDRDASSGPTSARPGAPTEGIGSPARETPPPAPTATQSPVGAAPGGAPAAGVPVGVDPATGAVPVGDRPVAVRTDSAPGTGSGTGGTADGGGTASGGGTGTSGGPSDGRL